MDKLLCIRTLEVFTFGKQPPRLVKGLTYTPMEYKTHAELQILYPVIDPESHMPGGYYQLIETGKWFYHESLFAKLVNIPLIEETESITVKELV